MIACEAQAVVKLLNGLYPRSKRSEQEWELMVEDLLRVNITNEQAESVCKEHRRNYEFIKYPALLCEFRKRHVNPPKPTSPPPEPTIDEKIAHLYHVAYQMHGLGHEKAAAIVTLGYGDAAKDFLAERQRFIEKMRASRPKSTAAIVRDTARSLAAPSKPKARTYADLIRASHGSLEGKAPANAGTQRTAAVAALEGAPRYEGMVGKLREIDK